MPINITPSKENIFKRIRKALAQSTPQPFPQSENAQQVFLPSRQELEVEFAEQFTRLQGKFAYCADGADLAAQLQGLAAHFNWNNLYCRDLGIKNLLHAQGFTLTDYADLASCDAAITGCELLVARTGSLVMSAAEESGRTTSVYAPIHICIARTSQLVYDIRDALQAMKEKYGNRLPSLITFASGPSRTADIEKTLVTGVHGPKEVYCFLIEG